MTHTRAALLAFGFLAALAARLVLLAGFPGNYDTDSYRIVAEVAQRGGDPYRETDRYNYSPLWAHVCAAVEGTAQAAGVRPTLLYGMLLLAVDAATAMFVYRLARRRRGLVSGDAGLAALFFFANPVSILVSSRHLQFDGIAILFLLLAIASSARARDLPAAAALAASLLVKQVTFFHPALFRRRAGWRGAAPLLLPYAAFAASFLPYAASWREIARDVLFYRGLTGHYGIEAVVLLPGVPEWAPVAIFLAAIAIAIPLCARVELARASLRLFLVILIFAPGFGRQYCVWPIALGALFSGGGFFLYSVVAGAFLIGAIFPAIPAAGLPLPGWFGPFWAAVAWLAWELREGSRRDAVAASVEVKIAGPIEMR